MFEKRKVALIATIALVGCVFSTASARAETPPCNVFPVIEGGNTFMKNDCPYKVSARFCYESPNRFGNLSCADDDWGLVWVDAFSKNTITSGFQPRVRWCKYPDQPTTRGGCR